MSAKAHPGLLVKNRKAFHEYSILETFEAGLELRGTEVKSCREKNITIADSYVRFDDGEAWLLNVNIALYTHGNQFNHDPKRERKLLLHKREIIKLTQLVKEKGLTVVPLNFHLSRGRVKVSIGVGKGKSHMDKRETLKKRQDDMDARRAMAAR
ncbi:MAG: SsrA-binding protein SmpB [Victivallales bacterium]|nr:SsrA-binding protein SmpB [Victivallales bacterium]